MEHCVILSASVTLDPNYQPRIAPTQDYRLSELSPSAPARPPASEGSSLIFPSKQDSSSPLGLLSNDVQASYAKVSHQVGAVREPPQQDSSCSLGFSE